jgi:hypothetical protein
VAARNRAMSPGAERVRRHRERKRNGCNEGNDENVTGNEPALLELGGDE